MFHGSPLSVHTNHVVYRRSQGVGLLLKGDGRLIAGEGLVKRLLFITLFLLFFLLLIVSNYLHIPSLCFTLQDGCPQRRGAQGEVGGGEGGGAGVGGEGTLTTTTTINGR